MNISYDNVADAMYIKLKEGPFGDNEEIAEGIILDLSSNHELLGIEILEASKHFNIKEDFGQITFQMPLEQIQNKKLYKEKVMAVGQG
ncbi:MAG: DUF2283 domain-containing protein [Candidatus Kuenenbacteria bacterium]